MEEELKKQKNKQIKLMIVGIAIFIIGLVGVTYSFFNYTRTGVANRISVGKISFTSNQTDTVILTNVFPIASSEATGENTNYDEVIITITGDTTYDEGIEYLITATDVVNTINGKSIPISIVVTASNGLGDNDTDYYDNRGGNDSIYQVLANDTIEDNNQLLVGYITKGQTGVNGTVSIKAYIDKDKIAISDTYPEEDVTHTETSGETSVEVLDYTNGTTTNWVDGRVVLTTSEWNSLQNTSLSFKVKVEANEGVWVEEALTGVEMVQRAITAKINAETNSCNPIFIDDNGTANDESDDITYFTGTNDCVDMNYVWYSGKLWRITAIYPDGRMKLLTEDNITAIHWGSNVEYDGSWVYQWLNEDFYDTLVNPNSIIDSTSTWNYSEDGNSTPVRPELVATQKTKTAPVGLLNAYEYYNSYRCIDSSTCSGTSYTTGYLITHYDWWLMTPYSTLKMRLVYGHGYLFRDSPSSYSYGVRPSIVIKSGLEFVGNGSKTLPYKIIGDKEDAINNTTLLSSRSIGEYVNFDNDLYRIVEINDGITKLTRVDYLKDDDNVITKYISSSAYYGKTSNTQSDDYWDYYLNNTWYNNIDSTYENMMVDGTYYLGVHPEETNYKTTICKDANLNSVTTANCTKFTSSDVDNVWIGKVGLQRAGEMFSSQLASGNYYMWLITPYSSSLVRSITNTGSMHRYTPTTNLYAVRPSITLKSGIKITGGTGMETDPFEISE